MKTVISKDGTKIAYDEVGQGAPVIIVGGAFSYRKFKDLVQLAQILSTDHLVINYDRRGRDDSGDTLPYTVDKEIQDIEAIIDAIGGKAYVYGVSSGGALALEAADKLPTKVTRLAIFEAPYLVDDTGKAMSPDFLPTLQEHVAKNERSKAVKQFLPEVGAPSFVIAMMQIMPVWKKLKSLAHTLPYDIATIAPYRTGKPYPATKWTHVTMPTLVMDGGKSPTGMRHAMEALAAKLQNATYKTLSGQTHMIKNSALAPALTEFFKV
jgi:pimeloyl-ACP methyl ester carboxylesterase